MTAIQPTTPATSVLPQVMAVQGPEGTVLRDVASGCTTVFLIIFTIGWNIVSWPIALVFGFSFFVDRSRGLGGNINPLSLVFGLIPVVFCIIGLVLIFVTARRLLVASQFGPAELVISQWPLRLGERASVTFRRRSVGFVQAEQVEARLLCVESASYTVGTDRRTVTETVYDQPLPSVPMFTGMKDAQASWQIEIPRDSTSSFETHNNSIIWRVSVTIRSNRFPDAESSFTLIVLPEVLP